MTGPKTLSVFDRFWRKVDKRSPDDCWPWAASRNKGYGVFYLPSEGRTTQAHRVAWLLSNGSIPPDLYVCHRCDNRPCCNPAHLFLGTHRDNMDDAKKKHRMPGPRKLTDEEVRQIRAATDTQKSIAEHFGISRSYVYRLKRGDYRNVSS